MGGQSFLKHGDHDQSSHGNWARNKGHAAPQPKGIGVSDRFAVSGDSPLEKHRNAWVTRDTYPVDAKAAGVAADFRAANGLPEPSFGGPLTRIPASLDRARTVASMALEHMKTTMGQPPSPEVRAAYDDLVTQTQNQLKAMTDAGIRVEYLTKEQIIERGLDPAGENPYPTARAQRDSVAETGVLMIASKASYPPHPILDSTQGGAYDQFRAVHDYFGHVAAGTGFDRHGEWQAWLHHTSMFTGEGRKAASSELHIENSFLAATGQSAPHFTFLLPDEMTEPFNPDGTFKGPNWVRRGDVEGDVDG